MAWPLDPVTAVAEVVKVPEAPLAGGVKVTVTPGTGLPYWSASLTTSGLVTDEPTPALWPLPETRLSVSPVVLALIVTDAEPEFVPSTAVMVGVPAVVSP